MQLKKPTYYSQQQILIGIKIYIVDGEFLLKNQALIQNCISRSDVLPQQQASTKSMETGMFSQKLLQYVYYFTAYENKGVLGTWYCKNVIN